MIYTKYETVPIRKRQSITGKRPVEGDHRRLWEKVYNLNRNIGLKGKKGRRRM